MSDLAPLAALPSRRPRRRSRPVTFAVLAVLAAAAGCFVGMNIEPSHRSGSASPIIVEGEPSGVYRLSVSLSRLPLAPGENASESMTPGAVTTDQESSEARGWDAACAAWTTFGVLGVDQGLACSSVTQRPELAYAGPSTGQSANLANALVFSDWHFDITGDVTVAATGEVHLVTSTDVRTGLATVEGFVHPVGGAPEKAAAAVAAGVDLLLVPAAQVDEFAAAVPGADVEVVGVATVRNAIWELCQRSRTDVCTERVLTFE